MDKPKIGRPRASEPRTVNVSFRISEREEQTLRARCPGEPKIGTVARMLLLGAVNKKGVSK